jgi:hypothetical protein
LLQSKTIFWEHYLVVRFHGFYKGQYRKVKCTSQNDNNLLLLLSCSEVPWILQRSVQEGQMHFSKWQYLVTITLWSSKICAKVSKERSYVLLKMTIMCYYYYLVVRFDELYKGQYRKVKCTPQDDNILLLFLSCSEVRWIVQRSVQKGQMYFSRWQYYVTTIL